MSYPYVSIIIPNFNGAHLLEKNLPNILKEANEMNRPFEIIVVDDDSSDGSIEFLTQKFPEIQIISTGRNLGFGMAVNAGVFFSKGDIILIINNDVWIKEGFFKPLLRHFGEDGLFSVVPTILSNNENEAIVSCEFWYGLFGIKRLGNRHYDQDTMELLYPSGTVAAYDKKKFLELEGFDDIYAPFYWEDVDLGYRAWKMGWRTIYEPESIAYHEHRATIRKFYTDHFIRIIEQRNAIIFVWKNIDEPCLLFEHVLFLHIRLLRAIFIQDRVFLKAFWQALQMMERVFTRRRIRRQKYLSRITDKEIITRIK